jgi:hypothetical protein
MVAATPPAEKSGRIKPVRWGWFSRVMAGVVILGVLGLYLWTGQSPAGRYGFERRNPGSYYTFLADGFISGHLSMAVQPAPELLALKDPYDPSQPAPRLHDASMYKGKYYLYFGAAPALVWFVPLRLLTGLSSTDNFAAVLLCCLGFLFWCGLWRDVMRRHFPAAGGGVFVLGLVVLGLGNMVAVMLRRAAFWEVPIAGAYFFTAVCFWGAHRAASTWKNPAVYLAIASLALGLAIGSRPGWVFTAVGISFFGLALALVWRSPGESWFSGRTIRLVLAGGAPVALCVAGALLYNYLRFDDPMQFGTIYQLAGHNMHTWKMLDWANVPINAYHYFFAPAGWSVYFPFFEVIGMASFKGPADYYGVENVYGAFVNLPITLLALLSPLTLWVKGVRSRWALGLWVGLLAFAFFAGLPVLLRYAASAGRYMVDFVPALLGLGLVGVLATEQALSGKARWLRHGFRIGWVALALYTAIFNVFVSFQHNELLKANDPANYQRLARFFNRVSPLLEKISGSDHGPIELQLRLPKDFKGKLQPLVVTGHSFLADYVYLYYTDATHIQLGFEHTGYGGGVSQPILVDYDAVQTIRVEMGSLYPPDTHPYFEGQPAAAVAEQKHRLKLWVNGVPYRDLTASFFESSPKDVVIGHDPIYGAFGGTFTGTIVSQRRVAGPDPRLREEPIGPLRLALKFPTGKTGKFEPIVVTGETGRGDLLAVAYLDDKHVQFTLDHWGFSEEKSAIIPLDYDLIHLFEIDLGSLHPPPAGLIPKEGFLAPYYVKMDGTTLMQGELRFHPSAEENVTVALNTIGGSSAGPNFSGQVMLQKFLGSPRR